LFIYLAGSPVIFMEIFHVSPQTYGIIFALISIGFIGSSQLNIFLIKRFSSDKIFRVALMCQVITGFLFLFMVWNGWLEFYSTVGIFFILLSCLGIINPNGSALALAPFTRNVGSASALLGCTQIGVAALASSGVGIFNSHDTIPIVGLMVFTSSIALSILMIGQKKIGSAIITGSVSPEGAAH
jgi:DHA1 family bicyclomycin/chloramphenicol resistance-like MFS transporter